MKRMTKQEKHQKIFFALTKVHRAIENGSSISWYKIFKDEGISNPTEVSNIKKTLIKMDILKVKGKNMVWNKARTLPNPALVEGIYLKMKEFKNSLKVKHQPKQIVKDSENPYDFVSTSTWGAITW